MMILKCRKGHILEGANLYIALVKSIPSFRCVTCNKEAKERYRRKLGMPVRGSTPEIELFENHFSKNDGCWIWMSGLDSNGYGKFTGKQGTQYLAHIYSYRLYKGEYDNNLELDHTCEVKRCVNPDHLEPVTHLVNVRRGFERRKLKSITNKI